MNENRKTTMTMEQLKKLLRESNDSDFEIKGGVSRDGDDDPRLPELKRAIRKIIGFWMDDVTISDGNRFTCGSLRFKVDASKATPWEAISIDKPITIEGPLVAQIPGHIVGRFIDCDKSSLERIVNLFR